MTLIYGWKYLNGKETLILANLI